MYVEHLRAAQLYQHGVSMFGESTAFPQVFFASVGLNQCPVDGKRSLEVSIELGC
jgi:hypothetical protein